MSTHPFVYCETCQATQPFFYDFSTREWVCFVCGHAVDNPENELEKPDIRESRVRRAL